MLPGNDVGVVLQMRHQDFVAASDMSAAPGLRNKVDALGCAAHEDDLARRPGIQKSAYPLPGLFIGIGSDRRQTVTETVNIGVFALIELTQAFNHHPRLLCGGSVIEPDERLPVN